MGRIANLSVIWITAGIGCESLLGKEDCAEGTHEEDGECVPDQETDDDVSDPDPDPDDTDTDADDGDEEDSTDTGDSGDLDDTGSEPDDTDSEPDDTDSEPDDTDDEPDDEPEDTDSEPDDTDSEPDDTDSEPDDTDSEPDDTDDEPASADVLTYIERGDQLVIALYWELSSDDLDLHLLAPGGELETDTDCYYANCSDADWVTTELDWGVEGYEEDDPLLVIDDIKGTGPEVTIIPEPADGTYTVVVHDYHGYPITDANTITVDVYMMGSLAWSGTSSVSGEDSYTYVAEIDWAAGTVSAL